MNDCRVSPQPSVPMKVICPGKATLAWRSPPSMPISTSVRQRRKYAHGFRPDRCADETAAEQTGRDVGSYVLFMVIADKPTMPLAPNGNTTKRARMKSVKLANRTKSERYPLRY